MKGGSEKQSVNPLVTRNAMLNESITIQCNADECVLIVSPSTSRWIFEMLRSTLNLVYWYMCIRWSETEGHSLKDNDSKWEIESEK